MVDGRFELQQAIVENQLVLYYQPIVRVRDRITVGVEALVRWRHPTRGVLPPSRFVPALERAGLARELTLWVLREAILQSAVWRRDGEPLMVGVNLSSENLRDASIYVTAEGTDAEKTAALKALQHAAPYVRRQLSILLNLKYTPELHFVRDTVEESASRVEALLSGLGLEKQGRQSPPEEAGEERRNDE